MCKLTMFHASQSNMTVLNINKIKIDCGRMITKLMQVVCAYNTLRITLLLMHNNNNNNNNNKKKKQQQHHGDPASSSISY